MSAANPPKNAPMRPAAMLLLAAPMLLATCGTRVTGGTETERTICRELHRDLPTYSQADTPQTIEEGARFLTVFQAVCDGNL